MEEKKVQNKKLTYEQLEAAARQLSGQLDNVVKENQQMKTMLQKMQLDNLFAELNFRFKVLEHKDSFNKEFTDRIIQEIELIMTVKAEEKEEE
jgi:hypothetical protein